MTEQDAQAQRLIDAVRAAQDAGNPVAGCDPQIWPRIVRVASRRWRSFAHRHPLPAADTFSARVEDLARGLLNCCAPRPGLGMPIELADCRDLAWRLTRVMGALDAG